MKRHHQILLGILILQVVLSVVVFWPRASASATGEPVLPDLNTDDVVAITITNDQGKSLTMRKEAGSWVLPDAGDFPVDSSKVTALLEKLPQLDTGTLVARTESSQQQLQVSGDNFVRRLLIETGGGETYTLYLGSSPRYSATHFRVAGQSETYLTDDLSTWEYNATTNTWIDTAYTSLDMNTLTQGVLENAQGTFTFTKEGETWTLAGLEADEEAESGTISSVIRNASNMMMLRPLGTEAQPSYGLDDPTATVTLTTAEGEELVVEVGSTADPEDSSRVVKASTSPYYVRVAEYNVRTMIEGDRESFIKEPPTPTPESGE